MQVREGYKQTEVGVIPSEWEVKPLIDVVDFLDGRRRPVKDTDRAKMRGSIPYYGASGIVDYVNDYLFDEELILLGEDGENILSRNCRLAFRVSGKVWVNNHAHVLKPKDGNEIGYVAEFLESINYEQYNTGTAQPKLNKQVCSSIPVVTPPPAEQRAIAIALSDVDALLAAQDKLIAKKREIKQATMQQLLTGNLRLQGFTGEWVVKRLGDVAEMGSGGTPPSSVPAYYDGDIPWVSISDMTNGGKVILRTDRNLSHLGLSNSAAQMFSVGTVLYAMYASLGECSIAGISLCTSQAILGIRPKENLNKDFLYYYLTSLKSTVKSMGQQGTQANLNKGMVQAFQFRLPPLAEQIAIATVLSDMDADLTVLEQQRDKTRDIKQGMMQELLTGRIRLV